MPLDGIIDGIGQRHPCRVIFFIEVGRQVGPGHEVEVVECQLVHKTSACGYPRLRPGEEAGVPCLGAGEAGAWVRGASRVLHLSLPLSAQSAALAVWVRRLLVSG